MFTTREQEVCRYLRDGLSNKEIAVALGISERGVKFHVGNLLQKTGVDDRHRLGRLLLENNASIPLPSGEEPEPELRAKVTTLKLQKEKLARRQRMVDRVIAACEGYLASGCRAA
jgi:DNA-binding CsgD family transcriptional regulator